ncbi:sigma-70 family RNA polymerase sigma factor [Bacillus sp. NTK071]|uniref:sigma-70 family RNA polymerase sigma factor n=1 Tax=Bacillus sp. NTK071 TaxID=2802175 RepID=UPI001A90AE08|nr:sigma-70 family RNA polymerase sigma factor [Bacillus sp. NTK071]MBN8209177.1 sigma-70 family RNA polymerase sigma factor [Bacillus sp. NTK071]
MDKNRLGSRKQDFSSYTTVQKTQLIEELMDQYGEALLRLSYTYVKDWGKAEDVVQEVFLACFLKLSTFRGEASLKNWIYRIAINRCHDYVKSWSFRNIIPSNIIIKLIKNHDPSPEITVVKNEASLHLRNEILRLPLKYRETFILFYHEDLSIRDISSLLDTKEATIKSRLYRARSLLETRLNQESE